MTNIEKQAKRFLKKYNKRKNYNEFYKEFDKLSPELKEAVKNLHHKQRRESVEEYFIEKNLRRDKSKEKFSPSEKYRLVITPVKTKDGCWNYSQGEIFLSAGSADNGPIDVIKRNYSSFPFCWIENHNNGHDYLIAGEDYQGQTVIELDTGKRIDYFPEAGTLGAGYCWVDPKYYPESQILVVAGCVWACPYEYRFYDFSDPINKGWTEIVYDNNVIDCDDKWPEFIDANTIKAYQTDWDNENELASILTLKREDDKLVFVDEWISEKEKQERADREESSRKYKEWLDNFKKTDSLYLTMLSELDGDTKLSPEKYIGVGVTYEGWCKDFEKHERRITKRIVREKYNEDENKEKGIVIDLEWGAEEGPIKLVIYKDGKRAESKFFKHSAEDMHKALEHARKML